MKNGKKIVGIACIVVGALFLFFSHSIAEQVTAGKERIETGQREVNSVNSYFSETPYSKDLGQQLTAPSQRRINEGSAEVSYYSTVSRNFQIVGIILILIGIAILVFWKDKKPR